LNIDQQNAALQISALYSDIQQKLVTDPEYLNMFKSLFKKTFTEEEVQANIAFQHTDWTIDQSKDEYAYDRSHARNRKVFKKKC
jgi:hypothetical protein